MTSVIDRTLDFERCYRVLCSRDARFDGWFVVAVSSTGIYCRPSCPAITPRRENVTFLRTAAAAQRAGFRACKRCRPDASPGSPEWNQRADVVGRAMRLIADGVIDREGVDGLARRVGYSRRQLQRQLVSELGAGPLAIARAHRAQTARQLIESTSLPFGQIAFAAGFGSPRQFNDTMREVFACTPSELRARHRNDPSSTPGALTLHLPARMPFAGDQLLSFLGQRAVPGVESYRDGVYMRALRLPRGHGIVELQAAPKGLRCQLRLEDLRDLGPALQRCRRLTDLDADPAGIAEVLGEDPVVGPLVPAHPGLRVAGAVDGPEMAIRAVLGQQITVAAARTLAGSLAAEAGERLSLAGDGVQSQFPAPAAVADATHHLRMPARRRETIRRLATALADGSITLDEGCDPRDAIRGLEAIPGIGPWTTGYIAMRALGDPDAYPERDAGVRHALSRFNGGGVRDETTVAERWRPWRAYAVAHLWASSQGAQASEQASAQQDTRRSR
jgi:AraC family transcriptional regulator, regulatory protein of adaptative response / DNA-3-methyladenine glycosylase II